MRVWEFSVISQLLIYGGVLSSVVWALTFQRVRRLFRLQWQLEAITWWFHGKVFVEVTTEDRGASYGRSVDGQLSTATVFVEVTAENRGMSDVRIRSLRCELYRRRFGFWTPTIETLPYFDIAPLDWKLEANSLPETRSVTFSRHSDYAWSSTKVQPGETLRARMIVVFSSDLSPRVIGLPEIAVKGAYAST